MLQQEEYRCGDHRMACRIALAVRRPISAELPGPLCPSPRLREGFSLKLGILRALRRKKIFHLFDHVALIDLGIRRV